MTPSSSSGRAGAGTGANLPSGRHRPWRPPAISTRDRVLGAALDRFGTRGVDAVSLDEIAADVGVRKQTVLYWFASKDELVDAVLEATASEIAVVIEAALKAAPDEPLERIDAVVRAAFGAGGAPPGAARSGARAEPAAGPAGRTAAGATSTR